MGHSGANDAALTRAADTVVVGSGPCGLAAALRLADAGQDVLLVESGSDEGGGAAQALGDAEIADAATHAPMALATRRGLGGTSRLWGGRAVPFDVVDFAARPHVPLARWPLSAETIAPWYAPACDFLDCGPAEFTLPFAGGEPHDGLTFADLERWCAHPDMRRRHGARVRSHPRIRLALETTVTKVEIDGAAGTVTGLEARGGGQSVALRGRAYVIAAGGVETARLLLASRTEQPALFGGPDGPLGRTYMGHLFGSIADIEFLKPGADAAFDFMKDASGRYVRRRFTLDAATQSALGVMNMAAWPDLPEIHDPGHRSAILSLAYLALATPVLGPRLMSEAIRLRKLGPGPARIGAHMWNVLRGAPGAAVFAARFMAARYASNVRMPGFFVRNAARRYALHYHAEHAPNPDSRVTLSEARDAAGMPRARIDLRFTEGDARSVLTSIDAMAARMEAKGIARIIHRHRPEERLAAVLAQGSDGFHQVGTARMADDPRDGVVDADARVHGVSNLYLAGSAVLPTSGQANPTLLAVALAIRLADQVKTDLTALPG